MMPCLLRLKSTMNNMKVGDYTDSDSYHEDNVVVIPERDRRTTRRRWCALRMRPRFELGGCHVSWCWTVFLVVFLVILCCPSHAMPVPENPERESGSRQKRYIGDNMHRYLMDFGYLPESDLETGNLRTDDQLRTALKDLQTYGNIPVTGEMDKATVQLMKKPRCGLPDIATNHFRSKRYALHGQRWHYTNLTWSLRTMNPRGLDPHVVRRVLHEALRVWSENSKLTFREVNDDRADILVFFEKGYHGDGYPFDGPGQILAHAFFPGGGRGGDAHFDEEESWLLNGDESNDGTSLFAVAAHEFGHSLGLSHSSVAGALMFPWYQGWEPNFQLPDDDRNGIQQLYGPKDDKLWAVNPPYQQPPYYPEEPRIPQPPPRTEPPHYPEQPRRPQQPPRTGPPQPPYYPQEPRRPQPPPQTEPPRRYPPAPAPTEPPRRYPAPTELPRRYPQRPTTAYPPYASDIPKTKKPHIKHEKPDTCDTSYDAVSIIRREIFIFKGRYIWRLGDKGLYAGYPAETHRMWNDLPKNYTHVDAVYERGDKRIVFFIGKMYYLYNGNRLERGFPRPLTDLGLPESLKKIDGAMVWGHNGKTYLFSGTMYWKFDEEVGKVELDYPRDMSMWRGVPYSIDTVFQWKDGKTYFFKGKVFWKFNDLRMRVENETPMLSAPFWMGCPRELESPTLPTHEREVLDMQPPSSAASTLSVYSMTLLTALLLHFIISRNP